VRDALIPGPGQPPGWRDHLLALFRRKNWRGFTRLYDLLKPPGGRREIRFVTRYGSQFFLVPWDVVDVYTIVEGFYESEVIEAIRPELEPGSVVWFVGANFGLHAITAKLIQPAARVVCFEPNPRMGARLLENADLNAVQVELFALALADRTGCAMFFANASGNPGMSTLHPVSGACYDDRFNVALDTAERLLAENIAPFPRAMVIDVEGAELEVLRGLGRALADPRLERLVFEADNELLSAGNEHSLLSLLRDADLTKIERLNRNEHTAHALSNYLARR
jgi:FkbM family methyltransferase